MKNLELKHLAEQFTEFLYETGSIDVKGVMSEFWFSKFGVNNEEREKELLQYWINN